MALFGALSTGRSGLIVNGAALSVIGNNIANVGTTAFKGSRTEFSDLVAADGGGQIGNIGLGARVGTIRTLFDQGAIEATGRSLDLAIQGQGFFVLREGQGDVYTRAGNFQMNPDGTISNLNGDILQGFPVDATGQIVGGETDINVAGVNSQAKATANTTLKGNLEADAALKGTFDGTDFTTAYATSNYQSTLQVYDSLGAQHQVTLFFTKSSTPGDWTVNVGMDDGDLAGGTPGQLDIIGTDTISFDTNGNVDTSTNSGVITTNSTTFNGAAAQQISIDLTGFTQFSGPSGVTSVVQDGFGAGQLASIDVDAKGILSATFDNGQTRPLFQIEMAHFNAPEGLAPAGSGIFRESIESGRPSKGTAQSNGNGSIVSSALEQSNVQIASEFINLISTQRAFEASAKVITASDQLLQDLINTVR
jgi:flagellar hook protein FlgE